MNPLGLVTGQGWKIATIGVGVVTLSLGVALAITRAERNSLQDRIENPKTGYVARLASSEQTVALLVAKIDEQNKAISAQAAKDRQALAAAQALVDQHTRENADLNRQLDTMLRRPLTGNDVCQRVKDADKAVLEMLK